MARGFEHFAGAGRERTAHDGQLVLQLLALLALVVCSALLTGAEAAYFSLGRARLARMADRAAAPAARPLLIERPHDLLVTLLVGITLINIGAAGLAAHLADAARSARPFGLARRDRRHDPRCSRPSARSCP